MEGAKAAVITSQKLFFLSSALFPVKATLIVLWHIQLTSLSSIQSTDVLKV